jgi:hypothetical protein
VPWYHPFRNCSKGIESCEDFFGDKDASCTAPTLVPTGNTTMPNVPTIIDAVGDPDLFAGWFKKPSSWRAWFAFLKILFGLRISAADLSTYQECAGRTDRPSGGFREAWLCVGRRGGKSIVLALIAVYLAAFRDWTPYLSPGERGARFGNHSGRGRRGARAVAGQSWQHDTVYRRSRRGEQSTRCRQSVHQVHYRTGRGASPEGQGFRAGLITRNTLR